MSAIEATRGDQSSGYHVYSLTAFRCPLAAESRVRSHHRFVRSSPDSGGGFSDSPLDSQSMGSAIFYALDSSGGCVTQDVPPVAGPGPCHHSTSCCGQISSVEQDMCALMIAVFITTSCTYLNVAVQLTMYHQTTYSGTPLINHLYKNNHLRNKIGLVPNPCICYVYTCIMIISEIDHLKNKTTFHGLDGGHISEVPLYHSYVIM